LAIVGSGDAVGLVLGRVGRGCGGKVRLGRGKGPAMSAFETEASEHKLSMRVKATANVFIKDMKDKKDIEDKSSNYSDENRLALYW
jgi:hypothetical protein